MGRKITSVRVGSRYGDLEVLSIVPGYVDKNGTRVYAYCVCQCHCGCDNTVNRDFQGLTRCKTVRCDSQRKDILNTQIKKLLVLERVAENYTIKTRSGAANSDSFYRCRCTMCDREYTYPRQSIMRKDFRGCDCKMPTEAWLKKRYIQYEFSAKYRKLVFNLSFEKFKDLCSQPCAYCGKIGTASTVKKSLRISNGIDRIDSNSGYEDDNIQSCCGVCNRMKLDDTEQDFLDHIKRIREYME